MYEDMFINGGLWSGILKNLSSKPTSCTSSLDQLLLNLLLIISESLVNHCIKRNVFGKTLKDFGMIQVTGTGEICVEISF